MRRVLLALGVLTLLSGCGGGGGRADWALGNRDAANTRVADTSIDSGNVGTLKVAWTAPLEAAGFFGSFPTTPLIAGDRVYGQDIDSNVFALDLRSGEQVWKTRYDSKNAGPNGIALEDGRIYGATATFAFALDADNGKELWRSDELVRNDSEGIDMQPQVGDGRVYVSTVPLNVNGLYRGDGVGVLFALDAATGKELWHFDTVPRGLWSAEHRMVNSGGGLWFPPALDDDGNVYAAIANPAPWPGTNQLPWGASRPGPNLYSNSAVSLDAETGELRWHTQVLPHDLYDWDLQLSPVLADVRGSPAVIVAGKMGKVYALDRATGEIVWERSVGIHNGHDSDNLLAMRGQLDRLPQAPFTLYPGAVGGVETPLAVDADTVYASVVNWPAYVGSQTNVMQDPSGGSGELVALDLSSGAVKWTRKLPKPAYGAMTVANDLVFTTRFDGVLLALDKATGRIVWRRKLPAQTNTTVAIAGDTLVTAASFPGGAVPPVVMAFQLP